MEPLLEPQTPCRGCWDHDQPGAPRAQGFAGFLQGLEAGAQQGVTGVDETAGLLGSVRGVKELGLQESGQVGDSGQSCSPGHLGSRSQLRPPTPTGPRALTAACRGHPHDRGHLIMACVTLVAQRLSPRDLDSRVGGAPSAGLPGVAACRTHLARGTPREQARQGRTTSHPPPPACSTITDPLRAPDT